MSMSVRLKFLGTGTSAGVPMIACGCETCHSQDPRDFRTRPSVVISYDQTRVLVDTTPELRLQAVWQKVQSIDAVVYTHAHADHIMGLDDLRRFNAVSGEALDVWASGSTHDSISKCFGYAFNLPDPASKLFRPNLIRRNIDGIEPFEIGGVIWRPVPLVHGNGMVLGFRVGNLAYCTDTNFIPEESFTLLEGVEVLVLDALQHVPHSTHFTVAQAVAAAARIGARQTYFTHIAHGLLHARDDAALPAGCHLAYDGLEIEWQP
jgi:phosphoribosyl 1,2-cyclic phosphate phosphodiesterase